MYTQFFGLTEKPFSITPDPRYLYMSARHADALAHLIYGISESGGFIQLTGEVGTGKTTLIRSLLEQLPEKAEIALILNPQLSTREFLQVICEELGTPTPNDESVKARIDALNAHLLDRHAAGKRVVLIVDEAQTLSPELLEQVRLLTNLETPKQKLLQIILIGQPELRDLLGRPEMRQIAQRVTGRYHLEPLTRGTRPPTCATACGSPERNATCSRRPVCGACTRARGAFRGSSTWWPTVRCSRPTLRIATASTAS